jgi:AcrR family transcriptional regulator
MARPVQIKDETIIEAARQVFLERGILATTAEVALRAGVSEGSVFKRFKSKVELFQAAMKEQLDEPAWLRSLSERVGTGQVRDNLFDLGMEIISFFRTIMPLMMMSWSNPGHGASSGRGAPRAGRTGLPEHLSGPNPPPVRALGLVTRFFEAEMQGGRLRRHDPEVVARTFLGGLNHFVFFEVLHRHAGVLPMAPETYVRGLVHLLMTGVEIAPEAR